MKRTVFLLFLVSFLVYGIQLFIFKDPSTTNFYILQDIAFLPISIAVATIVVGDYLEKKDKKERQEKTQMLCSSFYSEIGNELLYQMLSLTREKNDIKNIFEKLDVNDQKSLDELRERIGLMPIQLKINSEVFDRIKRIIEERKVMLLVLSSNPLLIDHEDFTKLLWGLFHLVDEFSLRGEYNSLSAEDIAHFEKDFTEVLKLLLINWSRNRLFTKINYPNYYNASLATMFDCQQRK